MVFRKICSALFLINSVLASLESPAFDKEAISLFGRRFFIVPNFQQPQVQVEQQPQQQEPHRFADYYDEIAQEDQQKKSGVVDGSTSMMGQAVLSGPDYDNMPVLKVSQKHIDTKKLLNANPFIVQTPPEEPVGVEPATELIDETASGEEPHLVDGETGPPSIEPPRDLVRPPIASRFTQSQ